MIAGWSSWLGRKRLLKRSDGLLLICEDFKQADQSGHAQSLQGKFREVQKLQRTRALLGSGEAADQQSDTAGVDHRYFAQIDDEADFAIFQQFVKGLPKAIDCFAQIQTTTQFDNFDFTLTADIDLQWFLSPPGETCGPYRASG